MGPPEQPREEQDDGGCHRQRHCSPREPSEPLPNDWANDGSPQNKYWVATAFKLFSLNGMELDIGYSSAGQDAILTDGVKAIDKIVSEIELERWCDPLQTPMLVVPPAMLKAADVLCALRSASQVQLPAGAH